MQSDVEGLCSIFCCTFLLQPFQAQRTRRRPSTPLMPGPLGGKHCQAIRKGWSMLSRKARRIGLLVFAVAWALGGVSEFIIGGDSVLATCMIAGALFFTYTYVRPRSDPPPQHSVSEGREFLPGHIPAFSLLIILGLFGIVVSWPSQPAKLTAAATAAAIGGLGLWHTARYGSPPNKPLNADVE